MEYVIKTHRGIIFYASMKGVDLQEYTNQLNNRALRTIALADMVLNKNIIKTIAPKEQPASDTPNVRAIHTVDGEAYRTVIEGYDAETTSAKFNNMELEFVLLGDTIINKNSFDLLQ